MAQPVKTRHLRKLAPEACYALQDRWFRQFSGRLDVLNAVGSFHGCRFPGGHHVISTFWMRCRQFLPDRTFCRWRRNGPRRCRSSSGDTADHNSTETACRSESAFPSLPPLSRLCYLTDSGFGIVAIAAGRSTESQDPARPQRLLFENLSSGGRVVPAFASATGKRHHCLQPHQRVGPFIDSVGKPAADRLDDGQRILRREVAGAILQSSRSNSR